MHKIAVSTTVALVFFILPTGGFSEVSDWRVINNNGTACIISSTQALKGPLRLFFLSKLNIDIAHHVVSKVIADIKALHLSILVQLFKQIFIKILEMLLDFAGVDGLALGVDAGGDHVGAQVR